MSHAFSFLLCKFPRKLPKKLGTMMLCMTNGTLLYYGKVRFASTSSWMPLAQRTRLQKLHACMNSTGLYDPTKHNQPSQSHTTSTENRNLFSMQPFHVHGQSLQNMEQSQNTISKEWTQDHIHRRKMSTILFWMHLSSISRVRVATDTSKSQFYRSFWRPTSISCERVARDTSKSQFYISFWRPTSISCEKVAFRGAPAAPPPP